VLDSAAVTGTTSGGQRKRHAASIAALLSFAWPGLGQWYARRWRPGLVFAIPIVVVAVALVARVLGGLEVFALQLLDPGVALRVLVLILLLGAWRIAALLEASYAIDRRLSFRGRAGAGLATLVALVVVSHGVLAYDAWAFYQAGSQIFVPVTVTPNATPSPSDPYLATPFATPESESARITVLLTGIDHNPQRSHSLTDTMLILSVDPATGEAAMVSFPRDIAEFPLYTGGRYPNKINSLMTYAGDHPEKFPEGPLPALARELGYLLGTPIHYYAAVDLNGFERLIDVAGGVDVVVERRIADYRYDWLDGSNLGFFLKAGKQHLDGRHALAFVRSRQGIGDNDFVRADRQQQLLLALRKKLLDPAMLSKLPELLDAAAKTIRTNFPPDRIDEMFTLMQRFDTSKIERFVLQPPVYSVHPPTNTTRNTYILRLHLDAVAQLSVTLFGDDSAYWTGEFDANGSPVPGPLPTAAPAATP
jgi:LCP family protein required for cell wall assembly